MAEGIHSKILLLRKYFPASQQVWEEGDCRFEMATRMLILEFPPRLLWPPSKGSDFYLLLFSQEAGEGDAKGTIIIQASSPLRGRVSRSEGELPGFQTHFRNAECSEQWVLTREWTETLGESSAASYKEPQLTLEGRIYEWPRDP